MSTCKERRAVRKIFENNEQQQDENKKKPMTREQSEAGRQH